MLCHGRPKLRMLHRTTDIKQFTPTMLDCRAAVELQVTWWPSSCCFRHHMPHHFEASVHHHAELKHSDVDAGPEQWHDKVIRACGDTS